MFDAVVEERAAAVLLLEELGERLGWSGLERLQQLGVEVQGAARLLLHPLGGLRGGLPHRVRRLEVERRDEEASELVDRLALLLGVRAQHDEWAGGAAPAGVHPRRRADALRAELDDLLRELVRGRALLLLHIALEPSVRTSPGR